MEKLIINEKYWSQKYQKDIEFTEIRKCCDHKSCEWYHFSIKDDNLKSSIKFLETVQSMEEVVVEYKFHRKYSNRDFTIADKFFEFRLMVKDNTTIVLDEKEFNRVSSYLHSLGGYYDEPTTNIHFVDIDGVEYDMKKEKINYLMPAIEIEKVSNDTN